MEWKTIKDFSRYQINARGEIRRSENGSLLYNDKSAKLCKEGKVFVFNKRDLVEEYFPGTFDNEISSLNNEKWKPVNGYDGFYEVSNMGRVKTVKHNVTRSNGRPHSVKSKILKPRKRGIKTKVQTGKTVYYYSVRLYKDGNSENVSIHRLVALAFVRNPSNLPVVNHKDNNTLNNKKNNLEWCVQGYNTRYAGKFDSFSHVKRAVLVTDLSDNSIHKIDSIKEAAKIVKGNRTAIRQCCLRTYGKSNTYKGCTFSFIA